MRHIGRVILIAAVYGCGNETEVTRPLSPDAQSTAATSYTVVKFSSSLGGAQSRGMAINQTGWVAGPTWQTGPGTQPCGETDRSPISSRSADQAAPCHGPASTTRA